MIRFEDDRRHLGLSVRDLADDGDYRFSGPAPLSLKRRALLGRLIHEDHQEAREDELASYRRERGVRFETQVAGWTVLVTGRIDGIYSDRDGRTVIEEIKTIVGSEAELAAATEETFPAYTRQLQLYRYLLEEGSKALGFTGRAPEMALHLLLIALPSKAARVLELSYRREDCHALVHQRLNEIIARHEADQERSARRRRLASQVVFPHTPRPHQEEMVAAIEAGLEGPGRVLVSAPPGIGKTAAALVPALRRAAALGGRVFVATSKTTQQAIFAKTVRLLREAGAPVRAVVLTARSKACLNDVVHCHPDACRYAADYEAKLGGSGAVERLLELPVADAGALRDEAEAHRFCPVEAAFDLTADVDVVIGDFNYVFDPGAVLKRMFVEDDPSDVVLLIDEAHNLYPRGMSYYSPSLSRADLEALERRLLTARAPVLRRTREVLRRLLAHMQAIEAGGVAPPVEEEEPARTENMLLFDDPQAKKTERRRSGRNRRASGRLPKVTASEPPAPPPPPPPASHLPPEREVVLDPAVFQELRDELNGLAVAWFAEGRGGSERVPMDQDPLLVANRLLSRFVSVLELGGEEFSVVCRRPTPERSAGLKILCKDPSRQLGRRIKSCAGAVAVSATLEPLEFYRDVLGFGADAALHRFPSPFDPTRRRVMVLDLPSTTYQQRERDLPIVEDAIRAVLAAHQGNYLVCCPSFAYLDQLARRLEGLPNYELRRQRRSMTESHRAEVLARLRASREAGAQRPLALLVVQGGIFTEGVDYPGQDCEGVIIVGPGLPAVSFERELIQAYYQQAYGRGFEYAFLYPGMNKVIQAAGRVIRTPTDTGVVVLVGSRFATDRYAGLFPRDWYQAHPRELISLNPYEELKRFWEVARSSSSSPSSS